jgi:hypothetical protein
MPMCKTLPHNIPSAGAHHSISMWISCQAIHTAGLHLSLQAVLGGEVGGTSGSQLSWVVGPHPAAGGALPGVRPAASGLLPPSTRLPWRWEGPPWCWQRCQPAACTTSAAQHKMLQPNSCMRKAAALVVWWVLPPFAFRYRVAFVFLPVA